VNCIISICQGTEKVGRGRGLGFAIELVLDALRSCNPPTSYKILLGMDSQGFWTRDLGTGFSSFGFYLGGALFNILLVQCVGSQWAGGHPESKKL
jgi:hypothetical protein